MKKSTLIGAAALSVALLSSANAESYDKENFSLPSVWKAAYQPYGYDSGFKNDFLNAVGGKNSDGIYHIGYGSVICNSDASLTEFLNSKDNHAGFIGQSKFPGCFYMFGTNSIGYIDGMQKAGHEKISFIMTDQPAWRNSFYDNKLGDFSVMEGYTSESILHAQPFDAFVKSDEKRWSQKQNKIKFINNIPDSQGNYPVPDDNHKYK